jgi:hypothetical protein
LPANRLSPPPFPCQFSRYPFFVARLRLGSRLLLRSGLRFLDIPRPAKARPGQISRQPQLLRKFLLLDSGAGLFRNPVRDRGLWLRFVSDARVPEGVPLPWDSLDGAERGPACHPLLFVDKTPDGSHQMRHGDVNTPFPENLHDPMHAETATVSF